MTDPVIVRVAHWPEIQTHLKEQLDFIHYQMERAENDRELWILVGQSQVLRKLLQLPDILTVLEEG